LTEKAFGLRLFTFYFLLFTFYFENYATWWIFAAACLGALLITLLTVSYQAIRAAMANPVNSLKTE
jgi:putative ABC transport system permease protein